MEMSVYYVPYIYTRSTTNDHEKWNEPNSGRPWRRLTELKFFLEGAL